LGHAKDCETEGDGERPRPRELRVLGDKTHPSPGGNATNESADQTKTDELRDVNASSAVPRSFFQAHYSSSLVDDILNATELSQECRLIAQCSLRVEMIEGCRHVINLCNAYC
jgi:hypothetical protein